ncbi:MAG: extracellular solute-binding protein [Lachnospiraceae bacterium]|jgi:putative spermidine/putrescine transport system substrate-binding protein|nr:extracellular solute-binding protein [Lachnospiraceae bacterium]
MKMKKLLAILTVGAMVAATLVGCGSTEQAPAAEPAKEEAAAPAAEAAPAEEAASGEVQKITLWATGSENVNAIFDTLTKDFNTNSEYAGKYEVELQFMLSGTGTQTLTDMLAAAKKAGETDTDYDIVDLSGDDLSKMVSLIGEESFVKLDASKIPNAAGVKAKSSIATDYCQPYRGTTVILAYDSAKVANPPKTVGELAEWIKANPGRFGYNQPGTGGAGDSFARTAVYNFLPEEALTSSDEKWVSEWDEGFAYLKDLGKSMYQSGGDVVYVAKNQGTLDLLNQGEIDMCPNWADMVLSQRAKGEIKDSIKITQLTDKPFTGSLQSLVIPTFGSHEEGAYAFINYMLSTQAQEIMLKQMAAIPLIDANSMDMTGYEDLKELSVDNFRLMSIGDLSTQFNERWDNEIGAGN